MLKNTIMAGLASALVLFSAPASADVDNVLEQNWIVEKGDFTGEVRTFINDDYFHLDLGYQTPVKGLSVGYRFAESGPLDEHRLKVTYSHQITSWLHVAPRVEYRMFNGAGPSDKFRFRPLIGLTAPTWNKLTAYAEWTPMWEFGGGVDGFDFTRTKTVVGVDYEITESLVFGPFFEWDTDGDFDTTDLYFGTQLKVRL